MNPVLRFLPIPSGLAAMYVCGLCLNATLPVALKEPDRTEQEVVYEEKPAASIAGQFRTTLASYLYAKAHEYMHGGVVMRAATPKEQEFNVRRTGHGDSLNDHHGSYETSIVPEIERDARGFWGYIERDTQPFMDIRRHGHRDLKEALPLFRLMTWSDPHFIEGYSMGAYLVFSAADNRNVERAIAFLDEGIENNPNSYILLKDRGFYTANNLRKPEEALPYLKRAAAVIEKLPLEKLENNAVAEQAWGTLITSLRKLKHKDEEIAYARKGLTLFPLHPTARRTLKIYGLLPSPRAAASAPVPAPVVNEAKNPVRPSEPAVTASTSKESR